MGDCNARDRHNAILEEWAPIKIGEFTICVWQWLDGGLCIDIVIQVLRGDWLVAKLDCAHDEIHTHFFGFAPVGGQGVREIERKVHIQLPVDGRSAAYAINGSVAACYSLMLEVANGRRP